MSQEETKPFIIDEERKLIKLGKHSKAVTLPKRWIEFQEWMKGKTLSEVYIAMDHFIVIAPPEEREEARKMLKEFLEKRREENGKR